MIKVKPNTVILIGLITLFLLGCLFSACTKTEERQTKVQGTQCSHSTESRGTQDGHST